MNNQEVVAVLQECKRMLDALASEVSELSEEEKNDHQRCKALLPDDLRTLIEEAKEMKWPFVPERWQYKQAVGPEDKTNLQDMINPSLQDLLAYLKASIVVRDSATAAAIVFLIDRFLYWADASTRLLQVAKALHKMWPATPIAPQVVIRQARISLNSGKLLKAEYISSSLINNNGTTGSWLYSKESDRVLVQSVCIQIRGQILQKLGMWYEAAELIWASIVGFSELPIPDKKGIATSLGILADIFISMSEEDYQRFKRCSHVFLSLLEEFDQRLLSAAEACKLAATYSLYTPLSVLTNLNIRGTCLLSYSLSKECPLEKRSHYLSEAKDSFEIGLLTKKQGDIVTSKQELHSFVKSAFCLTNVHKWLQSESVPYDDVGQLCRDAMDKLAMYTQLADKLNKGSLATDIMSLVGTVKELLKVKPFSNSDECSYVPDSYRDSVERPIVHGEVSFQKVLSMYARHHISVCEAFESTCRNHETLEPDAKSGVCVTALKTLDTISTREEISHDTNNSVHQKRNRFGRSNAINFSVNEEKKKMLSRSCSSHSSSSLKSWSIVSKSSSSWESVGYNNGNELPEDGDKNKMESICSTAASDSPEENVSVENPEAANMPLQHVPDQEEQGGFGNQSSLLTSNNTREKSCSTSEDHLNSDFSGDANNKHPDTLHRSMAHCRLVSNVSGASDPDIESFVDPCAETESATDCTNNIPCVSPNNQVFDQGIARKMAAYGIDPEGETKDTTEDFPIASTSKVLPIAPKTHSLDGVQRSYSSSEDKYFDTGHTADLDDQIERNFLKKQWSVDSSTDKKSLLLQKRTTSVNSLVSPAKENPRAVNTDYECESTEEEVDKLSLILSSSHGSSSWNKSAQFSSSLSDSNSFLNSSWSSLGSSHSKYNEEMQQARLLNEVDYEKLISGVEHEWIMKRLEHAGAQSYTQLHRVYNALHLKFSKKCELWTAQETSVYFGEYVTVSKPGKQRNTFWIHFLHQEETLGRYVGKEYKQEKRLLYHFNDVERQMTAQYYVTEFNKRLYELNIPTQIFYIPSSVLLILEGRNIIGCVTVEPYILGDFVKLSNNTNAVKHQYEATKYGLAFGHFTYEFTNCSDIVVDLQGWVTGSKKGEALIYLTDPQIHSATNIPSEKSSTGKPTCINFGKKGINYFFSKQHKECNEICQQLSLNRPDLDKI
ncbi:alpha-protein kinase 1 isoform 1-T3 [Discoglossus pictus]